MWRDVRSSHKERTFPVSLFGSRVIVTMVCANSWRQWRSMRVSKLIGSCDKVGFGRGDVHTYALESSKRTVAVSLVGSFGSSMLSIGEVWHVRRSSAARGCQLVVGLLVCMLRVFDAHSLIHLHFLSGLSRNVLSCHIMILTHFGEGRRLQRRAAALATTARKMRHMFVSHMPLLTAVRVEADRAWAQRYRYSSVSFVSQRVRT